MKNNSKPKKDSNTSINPHNGYIAYTEENKEDLKERIRKDCKDPIYGDFWRKFWFD